MKRKLNLVVLTLASTLCLQPSPLWGQGSLTPPGAPAPTMKTLAQIEPRTPISTARFTISQPGSYYLTTNLTVSSGNAVTIATNGVTLDLNGFTIRSTAPSATGYGILINGYRRNITIANGFIEGGVTNNANGVYGGSGFAWGIYYSAGTPVNVLVSRVSVSGCLNHGIYLGSGDSTVVDSCTVRMVGNYGITASLIRLSSAIECGGAAIYGSQASDCQGVSSGGSHGVQATTTLNCYGYSTGGGNGISASTAQNCYGYSDSGNGVYAHTAQNCYGNSSSGTGVYSARTAIGCYGQSDSGVGIYALNAAFCTGYHSGGGTGTAIQGSIGNGCVGLGGTNNIAYKYNMR